MGFISRIEIIIRAKLGLLNRENVFQSPNTEKQISVDKISFKTNTITDRSSDARTRKVLEGDADAVLMTKKITGHENNDAPSALADKRFIISDDILTTFLRHKKTTFRQLFVAV